MTQQVYISAHLATVPYGKTVYNELTRELAGRIQEIEGHSNNIWCRDYMPVKSSSGEYVQFTYCPSYMKGMKKYEGMFPDAKELHKELQLECEPSDIVLDGGAIEIHGKKGIVSDRVFSDNKVKSESVIKEELIDLLGLKQLIVIPQYPYDFTGHVDGLVRFIDGSRVVVNDMNEELRCAEKSKIPYRIKRIIKWLADFTTAITDAGLMMEEIPTSYPENGSDSSGEGVYINFLLLDDLIVMPAYGNDTDDKAAIKLAALYEKRKVKKVNAKELSKMGGMINCVTWTK